MQQTLAQAISTALTEQACKQREEQAHRAAWIATRCSQVANVGTPAFWNELGINLQNYTVTGNSITWCGKPMDLLGEQLLFKLVVPVTGGSALRMLRYTRLGTLIELGNFSKFLFYLKQDGEDVMLRKIADLLIRES